MSLEMVLMTPIFIAFLVLLAGVGRMVDVQSQIDGAARDAARAASVARSSQDAGGLAQSAAALSLAGVHWCVNGPSASTDTSNWHAGGVVVVTITCDVDMGDLTLMKILFLNGASATKTMTGTAAAPIDTYTYRG